MNPFAKHVYGEPHTDPMHTTLLAFRSWLFADPRHFQILALSAFLTYGIVDLGWAGEWTAYTALLGTSFLVQATGIVWTGKSWTSMKSAAITALGLCLLLKANQVEVYILAAMVAIGSKFLLRIDKVHIFNPANLGIVAAIVLTGEAWISPGQWGSGPMLLFFFGSAAAMVLFRVGRLDTSLWFLGTLALLEVARSVLYLGWTFDVPLHRLSNGALLLFTFFMITDPVTTPRHKRGRIVWSVLLAAITFGVSQFYYVHTAPIWTLFFLTPFTVLFNLIWRGERFRWFAPNPATQSPTL